MGGKYTFVYDNNDKSDVDDDIVERNPDSSTWWRNKINVYTASDTFNLPKVNWKVCLFFRTFVTLKTLKKETIDQEIL